MLPKIKYKKKKKHVLIMTNPITYGNKIYYQISDTKISKDKLETNYTTYGNRIYYENNIY